MILRSPAARLERSPTHFGKLFIYGYHEWSITYVATVSSPKRLKKTAPFGGKFSTDGNTIFMHYVVDTLYDVRQRLA